MITRFAWLLSALCVCGLVLGCGGGSAAKQAFSGAVTYKSEPVAEGQLIFRNDKGEPEVVVIKDGQYAASTTLGAKKVEITASKPTGKLDPLGGPLVQQYIPAQYNAQSTLTLDVTSSTTKHDFNLQ